MNKLRYLKQILINNEKIDKSRFYKISHVLKKIAKIFIIYNSVYLLIGNRSTLNNGSYFMYFLIFNQIYLLNDVITNSFVEFKKNILFSGMDEYSLLKPTNILISMFVKKTKLVDLIILMINFILVVFFGLTYPVNSISIVLFILFTLILSPAVIISLDLIEFSLELSSKTIREDIYFDNNLLIISRIPNYIYPIAYQIFFTSILPVQILLNSQSQLLSNQNIGLAILTSVVILLLAATSNLCFKGALNKYLDN